jgi:hypothetical protein
VLAARPTLLSLPQSLARKKASYTVPEALSSRPVELADFELSTWLRPHLVQMWGLIYRPESERLVRLITDGRSSR